MKKDYTIAVAGTGYVGLFIATLLTRHHKVYAVDIVPRQLSGRCERQGLYAGYFPERLVNIIL